MRGAKTLGVEYGARISQLCNLRLYPDILNVLRTEIKGAGDIGGRAALSGIGGRAMLTMGEQTMASMPFSRIATYSVCRR